MREPCCRCCPRDYAGECTEAVDGGHDVECRTCTRQGEVDRLRDRIGELNVESGNKTDQIVALRAELDEARAHIAALEDAIRATPCLGCFEAAGNSLAAIRAMCKDAESKGYGLAVDEVRVALRNHVHGQ